MQRNVRYEGLREDVIRILAIFPGITSSMIGTLTKSRNHGISLSVVLDQMIEEGDVTTVYITPFKYGVLRHYLKPSLAATVEVVEEPPPILDS